MPLLDAISTPTAAGQGYRSTWKPADIVQSNYDSAIPDSVGMDLKLPSVSGENRWQEHAEFLKRCHQSSEVFVKVIISLETQPS